MRPAINGAGTEAGSQNVQLRPPGRRARWEAGPQRRGTAADAQCPGNRLLVAGGELPPDDMRRCQFPTKEIRCSVGASAYITQHHILGTHPVSWLHALWLSIIARQHFEAGSSAGRRSSKHRCGCPDCQAAVWRRQDLRATRVSAVRNMPSCWRRFGARGGDGEERTVMLCVSAALARGVPSGSRGLASRTRNDASTLRLLLAAGTHVIYIAPCQGRQTARFREETLCAPSRSCSCPWPRGVRRRRFPRVSIVAEYLRKPCGPMPKHTECRATKPAVSCKPTAMRIT
jgi:hypothetical protein